MYKLVALLVLPYIVVAFPPRHGDPFNPIGPWHKRGPPCGLPKFLERLPEEAQEKVKAIWANYKEGDDCDAENRQTREIVHELPEEVREKVFAGRCGPTFLRNVSSTIRKEFRSVWFEHKLTQEDKELALKKLAYSLLSGESLALFNKWEEELQVRKSELAKKIEALSPEGKEAYGNWKELRLKEKAFLAGLPKEVREELKSLCGFRPRNETTTEVSTTTEAATTTTVETITEAAIASTTAQPIIEEKAKEKEFAVFLDISLPEELNDEAQCSFYM
ncbi:unnamed protein product [Caenorhabditis auriculariae]|uniref:SXP/RAL-2 family protein Ani s 5-like cation-binding domain-containing protein n=1 Tax=Caenorhabditis auriculariae TaxID=2777116 RepID=A0A8S1GP66_9PELO|nr:unnamed protein product [Caenorhabditis auriculariae]